MRRQKLLPPAIIALVAMAAASPTVAGGMSKEEHAAHMKMMQAPKTSIVKADYAIPDLALIDSTGKSRQLREIFDGRQPVVVNFIFTTCTTICPVITATTLQLQNELAGDDIIPQFVTISIDPDYDTADVMSAYALRYGADWTFLTGSHDNILTTVKAFDAYRGNKVNHFALMLMRAAGSDHWTRVEGLTSAAELARVWRDVSS